MLYLLRSCRKYCQRIISVLSQTLFLRAAPDPTYVTPEILARDILSVAGAPPAATGDASAPMALYQHLAAAIVSVSAVFELGFSRFFAVSFGT